MQQEKKYNKLMLNELIRRHPELSFDMEVIAAKLEPEKRKSLTCDDKKNIRYHIGIIRGNKIDAERIIESHQCSHAYIHEMSDTELIHSMIDWNDAPQGKSYMKWLSFKYCKTHIQWRVPDHDLDLSLDKARKKYSHKKFLTNQLRITMQSRNLYE